LTMDEKQLMGMDYVSHEEVQIAIKVAYTWESFTRQMSVTGNPLLRHWKHDWGCQNNLSAGFFNSVVMAL
jgi:hypothetical protein